MALEDHGRERVRQSIGVEPSGETFNSIGLEPTSGRLLGIDASVFESARGTVDMLRNDGILTEDPAAALDLCFQQCSVVVDCRDLALIAATLANRGLHPVSGRRAMAGEHISDILSVMTTCGMDDFAGEWVTRGHAGQDRRRRRHRRTRLRARHR